MQYLKKAGYVYCTEPFKRLVVQGMINGRTFCTEDGRYIKEDEVNILNEKQNRAEETVTRTHYRPDYMYINTHYFFLFF